MNSIYLVAILLLFSVSLRAQINGIAGSKLNAISNFAIAAGDLEFEPTFATSRVGAAWGEDGLDNLDEITVSSGLSWRMAYGLSSNTSIGVNMPSDFSSSNIGLLTTVHTHEVFSIGIAAGLTLPFGNRTFDRDNRTIDDLTIYGLGVAGTWNFNERTSVDLNVQYQDYFNSLGDDSPSGLFYLADVGHYIADGDILLVFAASYQTFGLADTASNTFSIFPAILFEHSDNYVIALNTQHDLFGKNSDKSFGFALTLTTIW